MDAHIKKENKMKKLFFVSVLFLLSSCTTIRYVQVDKPNMARFNHDQKMISGLSKEEVLDRFGSPDQAYETVFGTKGADKWEYHYKIFCGQLGTSCDIYFRDNRAIYDVNFRMEFTNVVHKKEN